MTAARRTAVALVAITVAVVIGLLAAVDASASTATFVHAETLIGVIAGHATGVVGTHPEVPPGQRRARAPDYDACAIGSCVAAEIEAGVAADEAPAFARSQYGRMTTANQAAAFERAPTCPYCGEALSTQVDHINALKQDWSSGGWADDFATRTALVNDPENLVGACQACNASKGARPVGTGPGEWWPPGWPAGVWWPSVHDDHRRG